MLFFFICLVFGLANASTLSSMILNQNPNTILEVGNDDMKGILNDQLAKEFLAKTLLRCLEINTPGNFEKTLKNAMERGNPWFNNLIATIFDNLVDHIGEEDTDDDSGFVIITKASLYDILYQKGPFFLFVKHYKDPFVKDLMELMNRTTIKSSRKSSSHVIMKFIYSLRRFDCFLYEEEVIGLYNELFQILLDVLLRRYVDCENRGNVFSKLEYFYTQKYNNALSKALTGLSFSKRRMSRLLYWTNYDWVQRINHFWQVMIPKWINSYDNFNWPLQIWQNSPNKFIWSLIQKVAISERNYNFDEPIFTDQIFLERALVNRAYNPRYNPSTYLQSVIMIAISIFKKFFPEIEDGVFESKFFLTNFGISDEKYVMMILNERLTFPDHMHTLIPLLFNKQDNFIAPSWASLQPRSPIGIFPNGWEM